MTAFATTPSPPTFDPQQFRNRMIVTTCALLTIVLGIYLLREFAIFMQPLLIAIFIGYLILPIHKWLVSWGIPSFFAFIWIVLMIAGVLVALGVMIAYSVTSVDDWNPYLNTLNGIYRSILDQLPPATREAAPANIADLIYTLKLDQMVGPLQSALGVFFGLVSFLLVVLLYLLFLIAEQVAFPKRIQRAFLTERANHILEVIGKINEAISHYLIIKTGMSLLTGVLAMLVLGIFQVDFFIMWGLLTFFLNYIPYLGSAITLPGPVILAFLQYPDKPWIGIVVLILLLMVHQGTGQLLEPRLLGSRLGVSPLLILIALSFWGVVWGVVGMILAVPLLVVVKLVLQNIPETQPIAVLMSNE